MVRFNAS
jgi:hypothetical protein